MNRKRSTSVRAQFCALNFDSKLMRPCLARVAEAAWNSCRVHCHRARSLSAVGLVILAGLGFVPSPWRLQIAC